MKLFPSQVSTKAYDLSQLMPALEPFWSPLLFLAREVVVSIARAETKNYEAVFIQRSCILVNLRAIAQQRTEGTEFLQQIANLIFCKSSQNFAEALEALYLGIYNKAKPV
jgi:hypothetical protein